MCSFVVLCVDETYYFICVNSDANYPNPSPYSSGLQVRGGGGGALKKIAPSGGRREICLGILCEKSRFCAPPLQFT